MGVELEEEDNGDWDPDCWYMSEGERIGEMVGIICGMGEGGIREDRSNSCVSIEF